MDQVMHFWALIAIACAIYDGLGKIANAIRYREVDVRFQGPIQVTHMKEDSHGPR